MMRAIRGFVALAIALGAILLLVCVGGVSDVGALGYGQSPVPTSTRPAPLPLYSPTPTSQPSSPKPKSPSHPAPSPASSPAPPGLPEAGGRTGTMIGWPGVLVGGGAALAAGLALRRTGAGNQESG
jgi:hypothetical protein